MKKLEECAIQYNSAFGLNIIPVNINKKPTIKTWEIWQHQKQNNQVIQDINWNHSTRGIAAINNPNSFISIDFDKCIDKSFVEGIQSELHIDSWLVKTGEGFHCHFGGINHFELLKKFFGDKGVIYLYPKEQFKGKVNHIELRIKGCYTILPPSLHKSERQYLFLSNLKDNPPAQIEADNLIEVISKYFLLEQITKSQTDNVDDIFNLIANGAEKGNRHKTLTRIFGVLYERELSKKIILSFIQSWNKNCKPPESENEIERQVGDLWRRFDKGLDNVFLQFPHCLLSLPDDENTIVVKIICFSVKKYRSDRKLIEEYNLEDVIEEYHKECEDYILKYESRFGKSYILRIGQTLLVDVFKGKVKYYNFSVYCGIVSFLGRNRQKPYKQIAQSRIAYLALGFKNELDYIFSESRKPPLSRYHINKAIVYLETYKFMISCSLIIGRMRYFSTFIKSKEILMELVAKRMNKKLDRKIEEEELREKHLKDIREKQSKLKRLKNKSNVRHL